MPALRASCICVFFRFGVDYDNLGALRMSLGTHIEKVCNDEETDVLLLSIEFDSRIGDIVQFDVQGQWYMRMHDAVRLSRRLCVP